MTCDKKYGEPLTLEQIKQMDGHPVWLHTFSSKSKKTNVEQWALVVSSGEYSVSFVRVAVSSRLEKRCSDYGKTWIAYAYPPIDRGKWTAKWIKHDGYTECSGCEYWYDSPEYEDDGDRPVFCPSCGRAMTPEAWAELEKRLRG